MDSLEEAAEYDAMDHEAVNRQFVDDFLATGFSQGEVLDLGTGTARIPIELCQRLSAVSVRGVDAAQHMLALAHRNVFAAVLQTRIALESVDVKQLPYPTGSFAAVVSNSLVHHIPEPELIFREAMRVLAPGGVLFCRDLARPGDRSQLQRLVDTYAVGATPSQRGLLADSLHAALTADEVASLLSSHGVPGSAVAMTSDRHWTCVYRKPAGSV